MAESDHHINSLATAFRIVEVLERRGTLGVTDIARETGVAKSSVYKHLDTLRATGYVSRDDGEYALSYRWFRTGSRVRERNPAYAVAWRELERLARRTGETASLVVAENGDAVYLSQVSDADEATGPVAEGERIPALASVAGKAIYSYRPFEAVEALLAAADRDADVEEVRAELDALRDQRLVVERERPEPGGFSAGALEGHRHVTGHDEPYRDLHSAAVPVRTPEGYGVAALEVTGPAATLSGRRLDEDVASLLVAAGKSVETDLVSARESGPAP
jgi:DNA-binding IclR family transcriptional regulator